MHTEAARIADQIRRAFTGEAWHGPCLRELLTGIEAEQAVRRPLSSRHSIWELVVHIDFWVRAAIQATVGTPMPIEGSNGDWATIDDLSGPAWRATLDRLFENGERLAQAAASFSEARLEETVPGRKYNFYHLFHGVVQHSLYHGGQIALLKTGVSH